MRHNCPSDSEDHPRNEERQQAEADPEAGDHLGRRHDRQAPGAERGDVAQLGSLFLADGGHGLDVKRRHQGAYEREFDQKQGQSRSRAHRLLTKRSGSGYGQRDQLIRRDDDQREEAEQQRVASIQGERRRDHFQHRAGLIEVHHLPPVLDHGDIVLLLAAA